MTRLFGSHEAQRGTALLVVVLMLGMIATLAAVLSRSLSSAAQEVRAERLKMQGEADLRAGLELAAAAISRLGDDVREADASVMLRDRRIDVRLVNERGRVDLNAARDDLLANLLKGVGVLDQEAVTMAAAILEWRGGSASQKLARPGQGDSGFSQFSGFTSFGTGASAELPRAQKQIVGTRYFHHPLQLLSVPGFSSAVVADLLPYVTVASGSNRVDPFIAPDKVLEALSGFSESGAESFRETRDSNTSEATAVQVLAASKGAVTSEAAPGWRVTVTSSHKNGRIVRTGAIIAIIPGDGEPYRVLYVAN